MRFRLYPTHTQETILIRHCADARYMWNLALEQWNWYPWTPSHTYAPGLAEQSRQLTELRLEESWIAEGSRIVQAQALRDFDRAKRNFFADTHGKPTWRRKSIHEGFRIVGRGSKGWDIQRLNRHWAEVLIPKAGWVRFRMSRPVPTNAKSYRVTFKAGQWHIAFTHIPEPIPGPGDGSLIGIDRGITIPFACSDGTFYSLSKENETKLRHLQQHLSRQKKDSNRRNRTKTKIAKLQATEARRRKDVIEKATTDLTRRCDFFRIENLQIKNMTRSSRGTITKPGRNVKQKSGLNKAIYRSGWGLFVRRLEDKAPNRVEKVDPKYTSQCCSVCRHISPENRKSQAVFKCISCGHIMNADINAAHNIAAGHAVTGRGGLDTARSPMKRQPQLVASAKLESEHGLGGCQYNIYVQSTAVNRKLIANTNCIVLNPIKIW